MGFRPVVVAFDVAEQVAPCPLAVCPATAMDELDFEGVEEALHWGVVEAVASLAHGGHGTDSIEFTDIGLRGKCDPRSEW